MEGRVIEPAAFADRPDQQHRLVQPFENSRLLALWDANEIHLYPPMVKVEASYRDLFF